MVLNKINKKTFSLIAVLLFASLFLIFSGCQQANNTTESKEINLSTTTNKTKIENYEETINENSNIMDFYGKPSVILFGSTGCVHCRNAVPQFKTNVYDKYKEEVNIWINVINKDKFNVEKIPQGFNSNLNYNTIAKKKCGYIPSWLILDNNGTVVMTSCGNEKEMGDMINKIEELLA